MTDDDFNYGELPESWWRAKGELIGADDRHVKFAAAIHRGASQTTAAKEAGYSDGGASGDTGPLRSAGSRAMSNRKIRSLLAMATAEVSGGADDMSPEERRNRLVTLARNADPRIQITAMQYLDSLDQRERELQNSAPQKPEEIIRKIHDKDPVIAIYLSRKLGVAFNWFDRTADTSEIDEIEREVGGKATEERGAVA